MNSEFNWWLLIVGPVVGAGLVWLVVADSRRREVDEAEAEREGEARWIAKVLSDRGWLIDDDEVLEILRLHAAYLAAPPPDEPSRDTVDHDTSVTQSWVAVPDRVEPIRQPSEPRSMAHPAGPDRPDAESGPA